METRKAVEAAAWYDGPTYIRLTRENLPVVEDDDTTFDGTAYSLTNGTSLRNLNSGFMGTGGVVGVDNQALPTLSRPEFEIWDDNNISFAAAPGILVAGRYCQDVTISATP